MPASAGDKGASVVGRVQRARERERERARTRPLRAITPPASPSRAAGSLAQNEAAAGWLVAGSYMR